MGDLGWCGGMDISLTEAWGLRDGYELLVAKSGLYLIEFCSMIGTLRADDDLSTKRWLTRTKTQKL
jgi:hypothetical protein